MIALHTWNRMALKQIFLQPSAASVRPFFKVFFLIITIFAVPLLAFSSDTIPSTLLSLVLALRQAIISFFTSPPFYYFLLNFLIVTLVFTSGILNPSKPEHGDNPRDDDEQQEWEPGYDRWSQLRHRNRNHNQHGNNYISTADIINERLALEEFYGTHSSSSLSYVNHAEKPNVYVERALIFRNDDSSTLEDELLMKTRLAASSSFSSSSSSSSRQDQVSEIASSPTRDVPEITSESDVPALDMDANSDDLALEEEASNSNAMDMLKEASESTALDGWKTKEINMTESVSDGNALKDENIIAVDEPEAEKCVDGSNIDGNAGVVVAHEFLPHEATDYDSNQESLSGKVMEPLSHESVEIVIPNNVDNADGDHDEGISNGEETSHDDDGIDDHDHDENELVSSQFLNKGENGEDSESYDWPNVAMVRTRSSHSTDELSRNQYESIDYLLANQEITSKIDIFTLSPRLGIHDSSYIESSGYAGMNRSMSHSHMVWTSSHVSGDDTHGLPSYVDKDEDECEQNEDNAIDAIKEEEEFDMSTEELNERANAFITAFRRKLKTSTSNDG